MKNKKILIGSLSLAIVGISCLAIVSKPTYKTIDNSNLDERMAVYIKNETGNYEKSNSIPTTGYILNEEKSTCNNNAKPTWNRNNKRLKISNLSNDNTSCYLYFDELEGITPSDIVAGAKTETPDFSQTATTDEGMYSVADPTYGGTSYYYRGAVTNNYVKFGGFCWRIIRFNGDGSIRMIYDGTTCHANGTSTTESLINTGLAYNTASNDNAYVGYMYGSTGSSTYEATHANINDSTIKTELDNWYDSNLLNYQDYLDSNAGFCNDRSINTGSTTWWSSDTKKGYGTNKTAYAAFSRILTSEGSPNNQPKPTLGCTQENDLFTATTSNKGNKKLTRSIGLITLDELVFAGGHRSNTNSSYYLYNGQGYWTMTPSNLGSSAQAFFIYDSGQLGFTALHASDIGIRPVINLRADTIFKVGTDGTLDNPYVVEGA